MKYSLPPGLPVWSDAWPDVSGADSFNGVAVSGEGVYVAGDSFSQTTDFVGGKEAKGVIVKYPLAGTTPTLVATPNFFAYTGSESFFATTTVVETGSPFIYATGAAQACGDGGVYIIAKYNTAGTLQNFGTETGPETLCPGRSHTLSIASLNGFIYIAGVDSYGVCCRPLLIRYDSNLNRMWRRKDTSLFVCLMA